MMRHNAGHSTIQSYYPKLFIKSQRQIMCGSNFYGSDVSHNHNDISNVYLLVLFKATG